MIRALLTATLLLALSACEAEPPPAAGIAPAEARSLFVQHCAICHGESGDGHGPRRRSLHAKPPDFRQASWRRGATDEGVRETIREGRPGTDMPAWRTLSDAEIAGLATYVLGLSEGEGGG